MKHAVFLALGWPPTPSVARKVKRRFSAEKEAPKEPVAKDRDQKLLPPTFIADKFGVKEGDSISRETAEAIHKEAEELGERLPNFAK